MNSGLASATSGFNAHDWKYFYVSSSLWGMYAMYAVTFAYEKRLTVDFIELGEQISAPSDYVFGYIAAMSVALGAKVRFEAPNQFYVEEDSEICWSVSDLKELDFWSKWKDRMLSKGASIESIQNSIKISNEHFKYIDSLGT